MPKFDTPALEDSLIAGPVTAYLEAQDKTLDKVILDEMLQAMSRAVTRQLMQPRSDRKGKESCTLYSHPCARKARLTFDGTVKKPLQARTLLKFLLGDIVELAVLGMARLAGLDIGLNNEDLTIQAEPDLALVPVHPDGLLHHAGRHYNVEVKSCDSRTFDRWLEQGGPDDTWGYLTQASVEGQAWREHTWDVNETCFVAVSTGSRIGSIAEWRLPIDLGLIAAWQARREEARGVTVPAVPYTSLPEVAYMKGREADAEWFYHGEPQPRQDKNGRVHGWDVPTGRQVVPSLPCGYCDFLPSCWPGASLELDGTRPVWIMPAKISSLLASEAEFRAHQNTRT